eukprot:8537141-Pyramimonas_sp.AAC.1
MEDGVCCGAQPGAARPPALPVRIYLRFLHLIGGAAEPSRGDGERGDVDPRVPLQSDAGGGDAGGAVGAAHPALPRRARAAQDHHAQGPAQPHRHRAHAPRRP